MRPAAVVIGLDSTTGLQTARVLARRRVPVIGLAEDLDHYCCRTRVCEQIVHAETSGPALVDTLVELGERLSDKPVLYPCTDASVLQLSEHRERLAPLAHVVLPERRVVEMLVDKAAFSRYARAHEVPVPATFVVAGENDVEEAASSMAFPAVVKPAIRTARWEEQTNVKAYRVDGPDALRHLYGAVGSWADVLVAQEWVPGGDSDLYTCNCYYGADGRAIATFVSRKLRQWPPGTGMSSLGQECRNDVVLEEALRLFDGVGYRGLGFVELKRNARDGRYVVIEPNIGRPTGRSATAEAAGVELLYAMYCDALGLPLPGGLEQRYEGVKWIDHRKDVQAALFQWRRGELTLRDWARSWRGRKASAVLSWRDPVPFVVDLARSAGKLGRLLAPRGRKARREFVRSTLGKSQPPAAGRDA